MGSHSENGSHTGGLRKTYVKKKKNCWITLQRVEKKKVFQNLINVALAQVLLGLAPITFFLDEKNMRSLWTWPFFCSKFRHPFEVLKFLDWFKKKWKEVETNFKQFQSVAFFSLKKSFSLLLFFVLQRNMRSLWTWPFFAQNSDILLKF